MIWHLIDSGFGTGSFNMDFDLGLVQKVSPNDAYFRLYQWQPYCISLGANQNFSDINLEKAKADKIDVVKRPTGGRAILHAEEITYSVVLPYSHTITAKEIYQKISVALIKGLELYNPMLGKSELENLQPDFPKLLQQPSGVLCFGSTAKNEVKFGGKKIIGSAQRKLNNAILQHGSILCGTFHKNLVDYLFSDENVKENLSNELSQKTIEIETILKEQVDYQRVKTCLIEGFKQIWQIEFDTISSQ
jgi:lipoyl(octanoyl) transferase